MRKRLRILSEISRVFFVFRGLDLGPARKSGGLRLFAAPGLGGTFPGFATFAPESDRV
jgi:hypothetical protein